MFTRDIYVAPIKTTVEPASIIGNSVKTGSGDDGDQRHENSL